MRFKRDPPPPHRIPMFPPLHKTPSTSPPPSTTTLSPFLSFKHFSYKLKLKREKKRQKKKRFKNKKNQESEISHDRQRKKKRKGRKAIFLDFSAANDVVLLRIPEIYCHNPTYARYSNGGDDGSRKRITLLDAIEKSGDRRTLETILSMEKQPGQANQTLMDIIRDEESGSLFGHKDKKSWKAFRDKLRLKRAGSAWTSSVHTPTSDIPIPVENRFRNSNINNASSRSLMARRNSVRFTTVSSVIPLELEESDDNLGMGPSSRPQMTRRSSTRFGSAIPQVQSESTHSGDSDVNIHAVDDGPPSRRFRPQISRHNSTRFPAVDPTQSDENDLDPSSPEGTTRLGTALAEERLLSAREAVAAQEAAEAAAQAEAAAAAAAEQEAEEGAMPMPGNMETQEPVRMSLMDLLEETDRQMGFEGSRYTMGDIEACDDDDDDDEEEEEEEDRGDGSAAIEYTCCVCMVRHKGAAFIPCGHTFCRLCSRELWVQRGNCPLCNGFISEILDIF